MIDHVSVPVSNLALSRAFYGTVLSAIGLNELVSRQSTVGYGKKYPEFWINARPQMKPIDRNYGAHVCLRTASEAVVIAFHQTAIEQGGGDAGTPGPRTAALGPYFGAFIFDPDGNKIEVLTFPRAISE